MGNFFFRDLEDEGWGWGLPYTPIFHGTGSGMISDDQLLVNFIDVKTQRELLWQVSALLESTEKKITPQFMVRGLRGRSNLSRDSYLEIVRFVRPLSILICFRCLVCEFHHIFVGISFRVRFFCTYGHPSKTLGTARYRSLQHVGGTTMTWHSGLNSLPGTCQPNGEGPVFVFRLPFFGWTEVTCGQHSIHVWIVWYICLRFMYIYHKVNQM